ncbi:MAG: hypothetical protein QGF12_02580 [SAR202 cluster bacterium]|jgi:hypothetical protein|nr:hypothetical protein [SAR202 cluster bacterium]
MALDARFGALLDPEYSDLYAEITSGLTGEYLELRARLANSMGSNVDWLVSSPAIRDNFNSPLFHICVIVKLLVAWHQSHQNLPKVIVDSNEFGSALKQLYRHLSCTPDIEVQTESPYKGLKKIRRKLLPASVMVRQFRAWWLVNRHAESHRLPRPSSGESVRLIDTFIVSTDLEEDRYYAGLFDLLSLDQLRETYIVPTFHNLSASQISEVTKGIRNGPKKILFKETYLKLSDILWACAHFLRVCSLQVPRLDWCGVDISPIWLMELKRRDHLQSAIIGLLNFRLFRSLKRADVVVAQAIDWFENQALDVGWNLGVHTYFPEAKTIGYQGFFSANHGASPTSYEYHLGVVPRRLCVMGPGLQQQRTQWCPELEVEVAPAFRFGWLWEKEEQKPGELRIDSEDSPILMTVLPADQLTANYLLMLVTEICEQYSKWQFWVKPHPALPSSQLDKWLTRSARVAPVSGTLSELFRFQPIVLSGGMTTAGLEALAFGLPSIFCSPPGYQNQLPVPDVLRTASLLTCASVETLKLRIEEIEVRLAADKRYFQKSAATVREELFAPVTSSSMASLGFAN